MNQNSLALFADNTPIDAINNSLELLAILRENYATETQDYGVWLQLGVVGDSVRAAVAKMKPAS